ncbi:hypothetical protein GO986_18735 [Deinococcus sp. HMF7620]|uniref:DUF7352 domain-containing protein n=1 Tax=Deinococcus arboris TaxID=2682977 RepID=A0A7C9MB54_9DEIO|nr:hypothetical protein [Deinococcus arboris]MVN88779.1 hypothetical protein [Deinococcus arboris]
MTRDIIFKYPLQHGPDGTVLTLPHGAQPVHAGLQRTGPQLWIRHVDSRQGPTDVRTFRIVATGEVFPVDAGHIATYFSGDLVWHVIELTRPKAPARPSSGWLS